LDWQKSPAETAFLTSSRKFAVCEGWVETVGLKLVTTQSPNRSPPAPGTEISMSVRKRNWFTSIQIRSHAEELAQEAGQADWRQHKAAANAALIEALRVFQNKKAGKRTAAAAALTLKKYPPQEAWIVDYATNEGRHIKTFAKKKEADEFAATVAASERPPRRSAVSTGG
jgi:hypothetical protein